MTIFRESGSQPGLPHLLGAYCAKAHFGPGDVVRHKGQFYKDMYLIVDGLVEVRLGSNGTSLRVIDLGPGSPVGEIGFLRGCRATGTVVARTATNAVVIDDGTLERIQRSDQHLAVELCKFLASVSEERLGDDASMHALSDSPDAGPTLDILLCRDDAMLHDAWTLRYSVYCEELGRSSPYADHDSKIIRDGLDDFGHTFIARANGETVGTLRANMAREGDLGMFGELYGMNASNWHPQHTAMCTKFAVKKSKRLGYTSLMLVSVVVQYGMKLDISECYIDCIPSLLPFYEKFGFKVTGDQFFHYENGPSYPMKLDLAIHGKSLCERVDAHAHRLA